MTDPKIARLIDQGQCQTVVLPPDVRLPGDQVAISQSGDTITLSPLHKRMTLEEIDAVFAEIDRLRGDRIFMPNGREQPPMPPDDDIPPFE